MHNYTCTWFYWFLIFAAFLTLPSWYCMYRMFYVCEKWRHSDEVALQQDNQHTEIDSYLWLLIFKNSDTRLKRDLPMFHQLKITYKTSARRVKTVGNLEIRVFSIVLEWEQFGTFANKFCVTLQLVMIDVEQQCNINKLPV